LGLPGWAAEGIAHARHSIKTASKRRII